MDRKAKMEDFVGVKAIFRGNVQGVGFRIFVKKISGGKNIFGTVRNLPCGGVLVEAHGIADEILEFIQNCRTRHPFANVLSVETEYIEYNPGLRSFVIAY